MSENNTSNNIENNELSLDNDESDYTYLNIRLKEIRVTIALLKKTVFK